MTLRTATPIITEPLPAPVLCLTGKALPRGNTVELNHIDTPANMNLWPIFHNGVANGLRITPDAQNIDSTWIIFNKPKGLYFVPVSLCNKWLCVQLGLTHKWNTPVSLWL